MNDDKISQLPLEGLLGIFSHRGKKVDFLDKNLLRQKFFTAVSKQGFWKNENRKSQQVTDQAKAILKLDSLTIAFYGNYHLKSKILGLPSYVSSNIFSKILNRENTQFILHSNQNIETVAGEDPNFKNSHIIVLCDNSEENIKTRFETMMTMTLNQSQAKQLFFHFGLTEYKDIVFKSQNSSYKSYPLLKNLTDEKGLIETIYKQLTSLAQTANLQLDAEPSHLNNPKSNFATS